MSGSLRASRCRIGLTGAAALDAQEAFAGRARGLFMTGRPTDIITAMLSLLVFF
jgi:hypothetical protein